MKNKFLRTAVILTALVLMTSCFVGSTFAKYVTAGNAEDSARVAKFGVIISASDEAFSSEYKTDDDEYSETLSVISAEKVVAPGTEGSFATIELLGTPEVAVEVSYDFEISASDMWKNESGEFYFPINININGIVFVGSAYNSLGNLNSDIDNFIKRSYSDVQYAAGTDLGSLNSDFTKLDVSWSWDYTLNPDYLPINAKQNDVDDTYLGDQAALGNAPEIEVIVSVTVTQID